MEVKILRRLLNRLILKYDSNISDFSLFYKFELDVMEWLHGVMTEPTQEEITAEQQIYDAESHEYSEVINIDEAMSHIFKADLDVGNPVRYAKWKGHYDDLEMKSGQTKPTWDEIKVAWLAVQQSVQSVIIRENKKVAGRTVRHICQSILDLIAGINLEKGLTTAQIDQMEVDHADILKALQNNRPDKAKPLIEAVVPDGTLITQADIDEMLEIYTEYGL